MPDQQIGRYEIERELGRGGMAVVVLARDPYMKRQVAIKVLPRQYTADPLFRARFQREAEIIAALEHPHIVPVFDFGEHGEQPYIVMRYMTGGSLAERLKQGPLSLAEVGRILPPLASALDEAHARGIIHRDLKPGNVLFDARGEPFISDFGIAKLAEASTTYTGTGVVGTPAYMSPEQARGDRDIDGRSDVYALGAMLFEMLTGKLPYEADTPMGMVFKHITEPVPRVLETNPDLPAGCETIILRAMAKSREDRYLTARLLARDVVDVTSGLKAGPRAPAVAPPPTARPAEPPVRKPAAPPAGPPRTAPRPAPRRKPSWLWVALALLGLFVCGVVAAGGGAWILPQIVGGTAATPPSPQAASPTAQPGGEPSAAPTETPAQPAATSTPLPTAIPAPSLTPTPSPAPIEAGDLRGRIAYVCFDGNDDEICLMNADGTGLVQLTDNDVGDFYPSLSNDGRYILFARQIRGSNYEIFRMDRNGANVVQLTSNGAQNYAPAYSPDDGRIVWVSSQAGGALHLWLMDSFGRSPAQLTAEGIDEDPSWSPDGRLIAFASTRGGSRQLWVIGADGSGARQITNVPDIGGRSSWSPDGQALAFYAGKREDRSRNIYVVGADGADLRQLTVDGDNLAPSYSPYGGWMAFTSFRDGNNEIYVMHADGTNPLNLTQHAGSDYQPRWGP